MKPWRYKTVETPIGLVDSVRQWLVSGHWKRTRTDYIVVSPDSPDYEDAPFESAVIGPRVIWGSSNGIPSAFIIAKR